MYICSPDLPIQGYTAALLRLIPSHLARSLPALPFRLDDRSILHVAVPEDALPEAKRAFGEIVLPDFVNQFEFWTAEREEITSRVNLMYGVGDLLPEMMVDSPLQPLLTPEQFLTACLTPDGALDLQKLSGRDPELRRHGDPMAWLCGLLLLEMISRKATGLEWTRDEAVFFVHENRREEIAAPPNSSWERVVERLRDLGGLSNSGIIAIVSPGSDRYRLSITVEGAGEKTACLRVRVDGENIRRL